jgi:two-component system sensor histidine kinase/response regulator
VAAIIFIFAITNFLRKNLKKERMLAEERARAIAAQNVKITEQNQLLERVNEEKTKLFSVVSHDLRAPIDSIRGFLELVNEGLLTKEETAQIHAELLDQTRYTSELLLNLLYWSKTQMQGITVHLVSVQAREIVEEITGGKLSRAARKGIKITHSINPRIEVIGDKDMLRIILRNLVNNAIKFTRPGGEIIIRAVIKEGNGEISVQDTGIGIPRERQDEIFQVRSGSTYGTENEKGIGLGLMLCKEFMEYQHGRIWFETTEGKGSTFYISLPAAKR